MLVEFIAKKLAEAKYELLDDGTYYGEIPGLKGVWANAKRLEVCRNELQEVLEGWLMLKLRDGDPVFGLKNQHSSQNISRQDLARNMKHAQ